MVVIDTMQAARYLGIAPRFDGNRSSAAAGHRYRYAQPRVDAIIPRIGASITRYGVAVVQQYEARNVLTTAPSRGIENSRDKLQSVKLMQEAQLPLPRTVLVSRLDELASAVQAAGGYPVVIKITKGTQGRGVILVHNKATARAVLAIFFRHGHRPILLQEFISEANGRDARLLVVGDRCVAAMERSAARGEFRANLHRGGTSAPFVPDRGVERLALDATALHQLGVAGVDLIYSQRGPLLLEVNSSPGLEGIERTTRVDVAAEIVRFLEKARREKGKRQRIHSK